MGIRTVNFEPQFLPFLVQGLADISGDARIGGHGRRLDDDCRMFRIGPFSRNHRVQRPAIARGSLCVVDDAERPRDYVRRDVLHEFKKGVAYMNGTGRERENGMKDGKKTRLAFYD